MYKIKRTIYGFKLIFGGYIQKQEIHDWINEIENELSSITNNFGIIVDMSAIKTPQPILSEVTVISQNLRKIIKTRGKHRLVIALNDKSVIDQLNKISKDYGFYERERYLNARKSFTWEKKAIDWVVNAKDPDIKQDDLQAAFV